MANVATAPCTTNAHGTPRNMGYWNSRASASARKQSPSHSQNQDKNSRSRARPRETRSQALHLHVNLHSQRQSEGLSPQPCQQTRNASSSGGVGGRQNRPAYLRLDSTGENSCSGSSEDLASGGGCSPQIAPHFCGAPRFPQQGQGQHSNPGSYGQGQQQNSVDQGQGSFGIFDRVRSVFSGPQNQGRFHQSFMRQSNVASESTLANLDLVADKFTKMSCNMMRGPPECDSPQGQRSQDFSGHFHRPPPNDMNQRNRTFAPQRYQPEGFHPYCGAYQSNFTFGYRRTFNHQHWQQRMGWNQPPFCDFPRVFNNNPPPMHWQSHQYGRFPWQPQWSNWTRLMQGRGNQPNPYHYQRQRRPSPGKNYKQRTNYHHGNRSKSSQEWHSKDERNRSETKDKMTKQSCEEKQTAACSEESVGLPSTCENLSDVKVGISLKTTNTENDTENVDQSAIETPSNNLLADNANEQDSCENDAEQQTSVKEQPVEISSPNVSIALSETQSEDLLHYPEIQRHSSIELILSDYESKSVAKVTDKMLSTDSDFSDADGESVEEEHSELWESFTSSDDPYNPLCGWRFNSRDTAQPPTSSSNESVEYTRDSHVDSGTDEGDDWSEGDDTEDSEADDEEEIKDEDEDDDDDECGFTPSSSIELSVQQLTSRPGNLSSTPKARSDKSSPTHHPSVAFILGSTSSSSEDEDDDDDWDTVDDSSVHQHDPLWESLNKVKDPYSPLNAWKCHSSNLSSPENSFTNLSKSGLQDTPEKCSPNLSKKTLECLSKSLSHENQLSVACGRSSSKGSFSDSETFAILAVRIHASRDEVDGAHGCPILTRSPGMKRVVSASCLRKVHLTPEIKATKKVVFFSRSLFSLNSKLLTPPPPILGNG